ILLLFTQIDLRHRMKEIHKPPMILPCRLGLERSDLFHGLDLSRENIGLDLYRLIKRRSKNDHLLNMRHFLQLVLDQIEIMLTLGDMYPGKRIGIRPEEFKITGIIHPKGHDDYIRIRRYHIIVETCIDILSPISPDTPVENDDPP